MKYHILNGFDAETLRISFQRLLVAFLQMSKDANMAAESLAKFAETYKRKIDDETPI